MISKKICVTGVVLACAALFGAAGAPGTPGGSGSAAPSAPAASLASPALDPLLSTESVRETAYGVKLNPPKDSIVVRETDGYALLSLFRKDLYAMALYVNRTKDGGKTTVKAVMEEAIRQMATPYPSAVVKESKELKIGERSGGVIYYALPKDDKGRSNYIGQAFMAIDSITFAKLEMTVGTDNFEIVKPVFEAVVKSMDLDDPVKFNQRRKDALTRGSDWHATVTGKMLAAALVEQQVFRIVDGNKDIGYMTIHQAVGVGQGLRGVKVNVLARIHQGEQAVDTASECFLSEDMEFETWSLQTTLRPLVQPAKNVKTALTAPVTWTETGARSHGQITINRDVPAGDEDLSASKSHQTRRLDDKADLNEENRGTVRVESTDKPDRLKKIEWNLSDVKDLPPKVYLSQAELYIIQPMLPHEKEGEFSFYSYYPNAGKLSLRTERVVPEADGSFTVYTRPAPEMTEQSTRYDAKGKMIRRELGQGRAIVPSTAEELRGIWKDQYPEK